MGKILSTDISTASTSWYQRLRTIQGKTPTTVRGSTMITKTTDPAIAAGTKATAAQVSSFITALTSSTMKNNVFLKEANWSGLQPTAPTTGTQISTVNVYNKIDGMLDNLEKVCANYITNSVCTDCNNCSKNNTQSTYCKTYGDYTTCGDDKTYNETCNTDETTDCSTDETCTDCEDCNYTGCDTRETYEDCSDDATESTYYTEECNDCENCETCNDDSGSPYSTDEHGGDSNYGHAYNATYIECHDYSTGGYETCDTDETCGTCPNNGTEITDMTMSNDGFSICAEDSTCKTDSTDITCETWSDSCKTYSETPSSSNTTNTYTGASGSCSYNGITSGNSTLTVSP